MIETGTIIALSVIVGVLAGLRLAYIGFMNLIRGSGPRLYFWAFWRNKHEQGPTG